MNWKLITDGSCLKNPGKGGWAFMLTDDVHTTIKSTHEAETTNNRMELKALIHGLDYFSQHHDISQTLEVMMDSQYILKGIESWLKNWKRNNWQTSAKQPVKNVDLWQTLDEYLGKMKLSFTWIKGHSGHKLHDTVDQVARCAANTHQNCKCPA